MLADVETEASRDDPHDQLGYLRDPGPTRQSDHAALVPRVPRPMLARALRPTGTVKLPLREHLQATLGDAYTLERELGGGGMARVFVAQDGRLGRRVVVKVLAPELTEGMSAERFEREIQVAARLQHPNLVPVLAAGERDGLAYYTMPYVEGESLRARLARGERLSVDAAVSVLRDVARALEYAHAHGVVHRDIKPENILLSGTAAAVADFGIAKALDAARTHDGAPPSETLTNAGVTLGTPAYMAPEQVAADPDVDARVDVYAWGVVAYELLAGAHPFAGCAPHRMLAAHLSETPPPLAARAPAVSTALAALVMRCLEKDPAQRPQSAGELLEALEVARSPSDVRAAAPRRRRTALLALGLVAAAALGAAIVSVSRGGAGSSRPVLVVLPFENLGQPAEAYFADGLTDEVTTRLAGLSGLQVIGRASAQQYKGSRKSPREIARELGATHLLTGTVRWDRSGGDGGRVKVSPQLVRASDQSTMWGVPYEGPLGDVFRVQASVAERVAEQLDVVLLARERRAVVATPTSNLAAYDAYLRGTAGMARSLRYTSPMARASAIAELERSVVLDSGFASAHAALARAYVWAAFFSGDPEQLARARQSAERAVALAPDLMDAQLVRAEYLKAQFDLDGATRAAEAAARLAPNNPAVIYVKARVHVAAGRFADAAELFRHVERLDPRSPDGPAELSGVLDMLGKHEEAIQAREREITLSPDNVIAYAGQAVSHLTWRADTASARHALERAGSPLGISVLARLPDMNVGQGLWNAVLPPAVLRAKDTLTFRGYSVAGDTSRELYHMMKLRHAVRGRRSQLVRLHADSLIALIEPELRAHPELWSRGLWRFSHALMLAEAYARRGRSADAARAVDRYVTEATRTTDAVTLPFVRSGAAYVDVLAGRRGVAVARLDTLLRSTASYVMSRALLRADPSWAPLRADPRFQELVRSDR